jgi:CRISPR-associated protein Csm1
VQVFLQGKLLGVESFVLGAGEDCAALPGRCLYLSLLSELLPRTLLQRLGLAPELLGTSGGGRFFVVITSESLPQAHAFLVEATRRIQAFTGGHVRLVWAATENLGDWSDVRKRLTEDMAKWSGAAAVEPQHVFQPFEAAGQSDIDAFCAQLYRELPKSASAEWSDTQPSLLKTGVGSSLLTATHQAPAPDEERAASPDEMASRAAGRKVWGILRGDVDGFTGRLRRAMTVEEHIGISVFYQQFFAGEVQVLCSQGEFWQKVSVLYTGVDDFAVAGAWDALLPFAQEIERLFRRSVEGFLKEFPGAEGKSLTTAIALAPSSDAPIAEVYAEAGRQLEIAKSSGRDTISVFGRTVDTKQLAEAAEIKAQMLRLVNEFNCSPQFLGELASFYRETDKVLPTRVNRVQTERHNRPWRFARRLRRMLEGPARNREFIKSRDALLAEFLNRSQTQLKLRPSGRVALEWARLMHEG